ncbi:MAG: DNA translocase FtsK 4TM domain-containing protein [Marvinbryantia sp.]|jgi:S-DNA-T family DNA segregation ATPase FtsK/SpoIIIE
MSSKKENIVTGKDKNISAAAENASGKGTPKKKSTQPKNNTSTKKSTSTKTSQKPVQERVQRPKKKVNVSAKPRGQRPVDDLRNLDVPDIRRTPGTPVAVEILLWAVLAFCVILFLSNVFGIGGFVGNSISRFFFGVFGVMSHVVPFGLFFLAAFLVSNRGNLTAWIKAVAVYVFFMCICAFCELLSNTFDSGRTFIDYFETGSQLRTGGGVMGGLLCKLFCPIFGNVGAWIMLIFLVIICALIITERSLFDRLKKQGSIAYRRAREDSQAKRELHSLKRERSQMERRARRQNEIEHLKRETEGADIQLDVRRPRREQTVSGVTRDTWFDTSLPQTEEIHEVTAYVRNKGSRAGENPVRETGKATAETTSVKKERVGLPESWHLTQPEAAEEGGVKHITAEAKVLTDTKARKMVDSIDEETEKSAKQMEMDGFTIQRAVQPKQKDVRAFSVAKLELDEEETVNEVRMPETKAPENMEVPYSNKMIRNPHSSKEEQEKDMRSVAKEIAQTSEKIQPAYVFPPTNLLKKPSGRGNGNSDAEVRETALRLQQTLHNFGVNVTVTNASCGPAVTRYELMPEQGVKVSRIVNLTDDIKLNLAAADIRIEAPIPGKPAVGIEVPNKENSAVFLRELIESEEFKNAKSNLSFAVGKDIAGKTVVVDIAKMPHLLIAGATGSGKSVCINTLIMSILYKANPEDVKLIMIDPKVVELSVYNGIPHLFIPVVTDPKKASGALNWAVAEMTDRYNKFSEAGVRNLEGYNAKIEALKDVQDPDKPKKMPQIVIIVDELADLMMVAPGEVEDAICRLAQLARAAGIHLIIATQRPSVNVITGLIKANMPSRIAFSVTSGVDSRTILDMNGAEKLLGKGDMLFYPQGMTKPARVQGSFVSDTEVADVVAFLTKKNDMNNYHKEMEARLTQVQQVSAAALGPGAGSGSGNDLDANFVDAGKFIIEKDKASIGMLQRVFKIGFNRAARIMDQLSDAGVVGPEEGTKPRKVLMTMEEFENYVEENL